ncbi:MAG: Bug family tripartite tricarboxylate transporter substrate binding protein, partial [Xanthobacteraceae bacterium]
RLIARHMGRHIPGEPSIVPRNMPGAGGVNAANWLASVAPRDGTTLHMIMTNMMGAQAVGTHGVQFDTRKFRWIGNTTSSPNVTNSWYTTGVTDIEQVKTREFILGAPAGTAGVTYGTAMNALVGTKFKIVTGYPGGNEIGLAMERGEVQGRCGWSWSSVKSTHQQWYEQKKFNILVQLALSKHPDLPDVPLVVDLAKTDAERQILKLIFARQVMGRPFLAPPDVPRDRAEALRKAFMDTLQDKDFLADADKAQMEINPVSGAEIEKLVKEEHQTSPDIAHKAAALLR